ncbi:MAG: carbon-nitrogen hydrolase [Armatimonadetes bacterium]|nr:carbon-nitrogen hydrolase [Armatimonadota bacterium]
MKVMLAQIAPKLGRLDDNLELHRRIIAEAWASGHDLVVFPELSLTGYLLRDHVPNVALAAEELTGLFGGLGDGRERPLEVVVGFVELGASYRCYNAAALLRLKPAQPPGRLAVHRKVHLPTYGMFDERRYFAPGRTFRAFQSGVLGRAGLLICEDLWHPSSAYVLSVDGPCNEGIQALIGMANSPARGVADTTHDTVANLETWRRLNGLYASLFGLVLLHCQRVGVEDSYVFTGGSEVLAPGGEVLARAPLFAEQLLSAELDIDSLVRWHRSVSPFTMADDLDVVRRELERVSVEAFR